MMGFDRQCASLTACDLVRLRLTAAARAPKLPPEASFPPGPLSGPIPIFTTNTKKDTRLSILFHVERVMGIEPTWSAWKAEVLPLNYIRKK